MEITEKLAMLDIGALLPQLEVITVLGKGAFGSVKLVLHKAKRNAYALKIQQIKPGKADVIKREELAMEECRSPFIMGFFGSHQAGGLSNMLLEYLCGGSMAELLEKKKSLPMHEARFYFACLVCGFECMHRRDWIHRDLKLENVVIANNGYAKIIDLGLAKQFS